MTTPAWMHPVGNGVALVVESTIFPGHRTTLPLSFRTREACATYCRRHAYVVQEGNCPLPRMPQGRPIRDDAPEVTKAHVRTMLGDE